MNKILKILFFALFAKPLIHIVLGLKVRNIEKIRKNSPAIIVANHASHIDTLILMCLFPLNKILSVYPIAAKDYFLKTKLGSWFFTQIIQIIPIDRESQKFSHTHPFEEATKKLKEGEIVIIYPEGTRSVTNDIGEFQIGVAHLSKLNPDVPVIPVYIHGPNMVLPKDESLLVPYICDVYIGEEIEFEKDKKQFVKKLEKSVKDLRQQHYLKEFN